MNLILRPLVTSLYTSSRPTDVSWFVVAVVIHSINRMMRRGRISDVVVKCRKIVFPFITDLYPPAAVETVIMSFRIITARFHTCPCPINLGLVFRLTMSKASFLARFLKCTWIRTTFSRKFGGKTSARFRMSSTKIACHYPTALSTSAYTEPTTNRLSTWMPAAVVRICYD